jgi:Caspase domain
MIARAVAVVAALALCPAPAWSAGSLQRFALVVGANAGGADRPQLQYAISDADRFGRVLVELGGVAPAHAIVLRQPKLRDLADAFDLLTRQVNEARRAPGTRTEVIVYYSGHADEKGLLFGDDRYSYRTLRDRLDVIPADVRIAVLDACSSGAFTRIKSGKPRPAFLVDESSEMRGHAFLTSSSENEAAQESDRIRASYFTHYLISGFRGAADTSGDGKVTLNEAYQFAFNETLRRTVDTRGGAQHPSYDINMSGTGDVVMTDVRQTSATLVLGEELDGRFFIRTASGELVVELYKPRGRKVELAIEPGTYDVRVERDKESLTTRADVPEGGRVALDARQLAPAAVEATQRRGQENVAPAGPPPPPYSLAGRHRIETTTGTRRTSHVDTPLTGGNQALDVFGGFAYGKYVREDLAVIVGTEGFGVESGARIAGTNISAGRVTGLMFPIAIRWNPFTGNLGSQALKPFVTVGGGPVLGISDGALVGGNTVTANHTVSGTIAGRIGGGVDVQVARSFSIGMNVVYNGMFDFKEPVGLHDNFNGLQVSIGFGWLFGKGNR